jgi:type IV pilus assembly protein PilB
MVTTRGPRRRLGDLLTEAGLLSDVQLKAALNEQRKWGGRLGRTVVELGFVTESRIAAVLARQLELPSIDLDTAPISADAPRWLRLDLCERYGVFPLAMNPHAKTLVVATSDPSNLEHLQALEFATSLKLSPTVATASAIERAIRKHYFGEPAPSAPERPPSTTSASLGSPPAPINDTTYELNELLGEPRPTGELPSIDVSMSGLTTIPQTLPSVIEVGLRREIAALREKVEGLEEFSASQVRALKVVLELLIEAGLLTREEYLHKLHQTED